MSDEDRHSRAFEAELVSDPDEKARLEARNALRQFDTMIELVDTYTSATDPRPFRLRPSMILQLHRVAMRGLTGYAGNWRPAAIEIEGSKHQPLGAHLVPERIEELCDYVNENWSRSPVHLAAYCLWRLNWIHPFTDGNGRTARAVSYLVLCARLGYRVPGTRTIPEFIAADKKPYYEALEKADGGDLQPLEDLLATLLARQLLEIHRTATTNGEKSTAERTLH